MVLVLQLIVAPRFSRPLVGDNILGPPWAGRPTAAPTIVTAQRRLRNVGGVIARSDNTKTDTASAPFEHPEATNSSSTGKV